MSANHVLILSRNNLALTRKAVSSVLYQRVPVQILVVDNDSTDGTWEWLQDQPENVQAVPFRPQLGVSKGWNWGLRQLFEFGKAQHVLTLNNDVELAPWFYGTLLRYIEPQHGIPFITGVAVDDRSVILAPSEPLGTPVAHAPDFSAYLITRRAYEALLRPDGTLFDERMVHYCSDCDLHVRGHQAGIPMMKANVPYFHQRSSTMRLASPDEQKRISDRADADRAVFRSIYGCVPGEPAYSALFHAI